MIPIAEWNGKKLEIGGNLDIDKELKISITEENNNLSIWISKSELKTLIETLLKISWGSDSSYVELNDKCEYLD